MLLFRSEEDVETWCDQTGRALGEVLRLEQVWALSKVWYHNRLSPEFRGRTAAEAEGIFTDLGLSSPFWHSGG
jgi:Alkylmercury lyase